MGALGTSGSSRPVVLFALSAVLVAATPLAWHGVNRAWGRTPTSRPAICRPSRPPARAAAFIAGPIEDLSGMRPGIIIIGDSMAGRIEPDRLTGLAGTPVAPLLQNATGSAYWYLAFKNWVVASGVKPRLGRHLLSRHQPDRSDVPARRAVSQRARRGRARSEPELNRVVAQHTSGPWFRVHQAVDRATGAGRARDWLPPALSAWSARVVVGSRRPARDSRTRSMRPSASTSCVRSRRPTSSRRTTARIGLCRQRRSVAPARVPRRWRAPTASRCASCA